MRVCMHLLKGRGGAAGAGGGAAAVADDAAALRRCCRAFGHTELAGTLAVADVL